MQIKEHIRQIPDFPRPGILFYDISTLLAHGPAWKATVNHLDRWLEPLKPDLLVGIESRGFLVSAPLAYLSERGFAMVRKRGKLPGKVIPFNYDLEYGTDTVEIQADAVARGHRVVVLDDLLATGGTMAAAIALLRSVGAEVVGAACIIELAFLNGRRKLDVPFESVVCYES
ncbi:MAG TPA: adenine phosphoribosyltransferase [Dongiaceae bacterium]|jgi:adenine phosphoribosyltransferase|nr:adenine phosphoribosyltransferase [Dongiaceae bacterium]